MRVGKVIRPNQKRQIVLPKEECQALGIRAGVPLNVIREGNKLMLYPIMEVVTDQRNVMNDEEYAKILEETQGAWAGDDWPKTEKARRRLELAASRRRKRKW